MIFKTYIIIVDNILHFYAVKELENDAMIHDAYVIVKVYWI